MKNESKFQMWRGTIALVQVDEIVSNEERIWLDDHLKQLPFTIEQKEILQKDFKDGVTIEEVLPLIEDKRERGMLINFANSIFKSDGLVQSEEKILNELQQKIIGDLNFAEITKEVESIRSDFDQTNDEDSIVKQIFGYLKSLL
ncbi:hypothetical protein A9Q84_09665 [Halobacteriovorax marinus]|uniref:TerB family tellurite resistance protein n=1 Tax=Halobacteriovorax marinus TaxID=97084 RepID=A0A1Y5F6S9_9BACT|nr:hypothetical protein A9Q84_09665 [Halobacteriovorax marinus]